MRQGARASAAPGARLRSHERIRRRADFKRVYDRGSKVHGRFLTLFALPNDLAYARLGVAATRKLGNAVVRSRAKRLIREVFRRNKPAPGFDIVIVAKRDLLDAPLTSLDAEYLRSLSRARAAPRL